MSKLIVNADDFGLHKSVNEGIIVGHTKGIITSTSLLASGHAFNDAISLAKQYPTLGMGIHIALVGGIPPVSDPSEVPSLLTKQGVFVDNYIELMKRIYAGHINYDELRLEIDNQIRKIVDTGIPVTHIDGHQHMHILPSVLPIVMERALAYGINAIRIPNERTRFFNGVYNPIRIVGKTGLSNVAAKALPQVRHNGIRSTQYFWGMINGGQLGQKPLIQILKAVHKLGGTHEIMTHPGMNNHTLNMCYPWNYHWEQELEALTSDHTRRYVMQHNIELINYGDLL